MTSVDAFAQPDIGLLASCVEQMAAAMSQPAVEAVQTRAFLEWLLFTSQSDGGKEVWPCLRAGLITKIEARDLVMAHCATWLSNANSVVEPGYDNWGSEELEATFYEALFGHTVA